MEEELKNSEQDHKDYLDALQVVYNTLNAGQQATGVFTLLDCKNIKYSYVFLTSRVKGSPVPMAFDNKDLTNAFSVLFKSAELLQSKGIFSIDVAVEILSKLELISAQLNAWMGE
jgi:hypothetical protein